MTETPISFELDTDSMMTFFGTLTTLELEHALELGLAIDDEETDADPSISEMFSILGVMAARRLGHKKITKADISQVPLGTVSALIAKASETAPTLNQRTLDLLADLSGEGARP